MSFMDPEGTTFDADDDEETGPQGPVGEPMDQVGTPFEGGDEWDDDRAERN